MEILVTLLFGGIAGFIASIIMKNQNEAIMNVMMGIIGAFVVDFIMNILRQSRVNNFSLYSILVSILGSIIIIILYKIFTRRTTM